MSFVYVFLNVPVAVSREFPHHEGVAKSDEVRQVGRAVAARRGELGMTQQDLADEAGVDIKTVYNLESGGHWPIAKNRAALSVALHWEADALNVIAAGGDPSHDGPPVTPDGGISSVRMLQSASRLAEGAPLAPPPLEQGDDPFPGIAPEIEPDVMAEFGLIEPVVREVQARHPEVAIRGEWVFPGSGRESRIWDNLTAIGFSPWQRAMALAVIRVTDRAQSGSDSGTGLSKSGLPAPV